MHYSLHRIWRASGPSAPRKAMEALSGRNEACVVSNARGSIGFNGCERPEPSKVRNDYRSLDHRIWRASDTSARLRFCGLVFALEIVQSAAALRKLAVLFAH